MGKALTLIAVTLLLAGCDEDVFQTAGPDMQMDSESCRAAVADQLSHERSSVTMDSDRQALAYEQRYRFCMTEKGYDLAKVTP